jgi:cytochrome c-type biogenesis protein CcmE
MSSMKPKHQRLTLAVLAVVALLGSGALAAFALRDSASYFYTPSDILTKQPAAGKAIRIGGMVEQGSITRAEDGVTVTFIVGDGKAKQAVHYKGITPDLFVEGSGVVADGRMRTDGVFEAETLLAKHDENYVPRELADMEQHKAAAEKTLVQ